MIQQIVGERGRRATEVSAGHIAKGIIAAGVDLPALTRTGGAQRVEPVQLVGGAASAVEVLVLGAAPVERPLPELAQVGGDVTRVVGRPTQAVTQGATATGAGACPWLRAAVAGPHQSVLLIVAEVLRLRAARVGRVGHRSLGQRAAGHVAGRIVGEVLAEDRTRGAAAALPGGSDALQAQVAVVAQRMGKGPVTRPRPLSTLGHRVCKDPTRQIGKSSPLSCLLTDPAYGKLPLLEIASLLNFTPALIASFWMIRISLKDVDQLIILKNEDFPSLVLVFEVLTRYFKVLSTDIIFHMVPPRKTTKKTSLLTLKI